ncbi:BtpA/SgcQ family protein [Saccharopolyspora sp. 5N708]|uniref:BtpA/SgcQ family protein n=1 Tax=Saccharopolyspora sp. 5N708 TaxID=3457424 RepID=UPI003FD2E685
MTTWLNDVFAAPKPIIAMLHLSALPGDPGYDTEAGISAIVDRAKGELAALQAGGVDGVMISNEFSLPYLTQTEPITAISMARIIAELLPDIAIPYGVNVLWDGRASIDLAVATGAQWVREIFTGVYASDFGLWNTNIGEVARHRHRIGADDVKLLFNIVPESAQYLADRSLQSIAETTVFAARPDALCVSGLTAGAPTDTQSLKIVKNAAGNVPVFVNTGVKAHNVAEQLAIADGAVVGTYFKEDGVFENRASLARVQELIGAVRDFRATL